MLKKLTIFSLTLALMISVGCNQPTNQQANLDDQIESKLDSNNLKDVDANLGQDGTVELTGTVQSEDQKALAEQTARSVSGVKQVNNLIKVSHDDDIGIGTTPDNTGDNNADNNADKTDDNIGLGTDDDNDDVNKDNEAKDDKATTNDGWVSFKTKLALYADRRVSGNDIDVESKNGEVSLIGKVPDNNSKSAAVEVAKKIKGVKRVNDQLQIVPASKREIVDDTDDNILKNVDTALDQDAATKDLNLKVRSNAGVVTLTGNADNYEQVEKAIEHISKVKGVKAVNANAVVIKNANQPNQKNAKAKGSY